MHDLRGAFATLSFYASAVAEDDRLLTAGQVAEIFSRTDWWVYNVFSHEVPPLKFGRHSRWERWQIKAYIEAHRTDGGR